MGDMADYLIEQGEDAYFAHLADDCEDPCPYCEDEDGVEQRKQPKRAAAEGTGGDE